MMNNQAPYCLMSARFNQKLDKIELIECNSRATQELQIKAENDFESFISSIYIRKKYKPNFMISNNQIEEQSNYQNSLKGQIKSMIQKEIQKQKQDKAEMKKFQRQLTLKNKKQKIKQQAQQRKEKDVNQIADENKVDSSNYGVDKDCDSSVKKLKLFHFDKELNQESILTAKLSLFKWHQYYVIITIEKKKQKNQPEQKSKAQTLYSLPQKEKSHSLSVHNNLQKQYQFVNTKMNNQPFSALLPPTTQMGSLNNISTTSNNLYTVNNGLANQPSFVQNTNISINAQNIPHIKLLQHSENTNNYNSSLQTSAATPILLNQLNFQNNNTNSSTFQDPSRKDWIIEVFQETIKIILLKLELFQKKFDTKKLAQLNIDPSSYFKSFVSEIQLQNANLLKLVKIKSQKQQTLIQKVLIKDLSVAIKQHFEPLFRESQIQLFIDQERDDQISTDQSFVQQIIVNIITHCYRLLEESSNSQKSKQQPQYIALKYSKNNLNQTLKVQIQMPFVKDHKFDSTKFSDISLEGMKQDKINQKQLFLDLKLSHQLLIILNKQKISELYNEQFKQNQIQSNFLIPYPSPKEQPDINHQKNTHNDINERKNSIKASEYTFQQLNNTQQSFQTPIISPINSFQKITTTGNLILSPILSSRHSFQNHPSASIIGNTSLCYSPKKFNTKEKKMFNESGLEIDFNTSNYPLNNNYQNQNQNTMTEFRKNSFDSRNQFNQGSSFSSPNNQTYQHLRGKNKNIFPKFKQNKNEQNASLNSRNNNLENKDQISLNERNLDHIKFLKSNQQPDKKYEQNQYQDEKQHQYNPNMHNFAQFANKLFKPSITDNSNFSFKELENEYLKGPFQFSEKTISNNSAQFKPLMHNQVVSTKNENKISYENSRYQNIDKEKSHNKISLENTHIDDLETIKFKVNHKQIFISFQIFDQSKSNLLQTQRNPLKNNHQQENDINKDIIFSSRHKDFISNKIDQIQELNSIDSSVDDLFNQLNDSNDSIKRWVDQQQILSKNNHQYQEI